ncbi:hypothetical protein [Paractinoplanes lichenicola]|uniref:Uncharacterized protein n=1 Tax=Paractinoplanes lichenicola TaxID=2802976 RepID=A0ABS1VUL7_9ACTN|nr:hypothetical protein [Actinoplanes lichenicola]MBL7258129.1 hypothetical protein [Actinoplanes lichenicola]
MSDGNDRNRANVLVIRGPNPHSFPAEVAWAANVIASYVNGFADGVRRPPDENIHRIDEAGGTTEEVRAAAEEQLECQCVPGAAFSGKPCGFIMAGPERPGVDIALVWGPEVGELLKKPGA